MGRHGDAGEHVTVAVVGDRVAGHAPQDAIESALVHAADAAGVDVRTRWCPTTTLAHAAAATLQDADAIWCAPGGPFASLDGALAGIRFAREHDRPFIGTCAGFQHGVLEVARDLVGARDAQHAEYGAASGPLFIDELLCSLVGRTMRVRLVDETLRDVYGADRADEEYYCRFGLNEAYAPALADAGLLVAGVDAADGTTRIMRLAGHPFFCLTLFVPQTSSRPRRPHPLVAAYLAAAQQASTRVHR